MGKKLLVGSGILIGIYIVVANATGFGKAFSAVGEVATKYAKTLQGRA